MCYRQASIYTSTYTPFPFRIEYLRNLPSKGRIMLVTNAIAKAALVHYEYSPALEDTCISLYHGSDFINLTKLTALMLQNEKERNAKKGITKRTNIWGMDLENLERHR